MKNLLTNRKSTHFSLKIKWFVFFTILLGFLGLSRAQVAINTDNSAPHPSAMLEVKATGMGLLVPRMTLAQRPASPATGLLIYQTDSDPGYYFYNGSVWKRFGVADSDFWTANGSNIYFNTGDISVGNINADQHAIFAEKYINGKAAVRGAGQTGGSLYAEGMLGIATGLFGDNILGLPVLVRNTGVLGIKPNNGGNGAAIYGWNNDDNAENYAGILYADGIASGTNYGLYATAANATTNYAVFGEAKGGNANYAGRFKGRMLIESQNNGSVATDYTSNLFTSIVTHNGAVDTRAIDAYSKPVDGYGIAIFGTGGYRGVFGHGDGGSYPGSVVGVYGYSTGIAGTRYGLIGEASGAGLSQAIGVYGTASGATTNWAGYFNSGDVFVLNNQAIGTLTPEARLHISNSSGSNNPTGLLIDQNSTNTSGVQYGAFISNNPATTSTAYGVYTERISGGDGARYGYRNFMDGGTGMRYGFASSIYADITNSSTIYGVYSFVSGTATTGTSYAGYFSGGSGSSSWSLYAPGRNYLGTTVAIATITPATGYALSVNGKIACEEILIDDSGFWPDYVFADDYPLLSIDEFEQSINQNKHLPGMPSAQEIEERGGHHIGEIQKKTLEKVEELSLYIIELNKRMKTLEAENRELKNQISKQ